MPQYKPNRPEELAPVVRRVTLRAVLDDGTLAVRDDEGREFACDWLDTGVALPLAPGDPLLAFAPCALSRGIVLGRVGRYAPSHLQAAITLEATESLTLKCGDASIDLRADGKVMVRGDDVLIRAKGTQRIRAGNVAIN